MLGGYPQSTLGTVELILVRFLENKTPWQLLLRCGNIYSWKAMLLSFTVLISLHGLLSCSTWYADDFIDDLQWHAASDDSPSWSHTYNHNRASSIMDQAHHHTNSVHTVYSLAYVTPGRVSHPHSITTCKPYHGGHHQQQLSRHACTPMPCLLQPYHALKSRFHFQVSCQIRGLPHSLFTSQQHHSCWSVKSEAFGQCIKSAKNTVWQYWHHRCPTLSMVWHRLQLDEESKGSNPSIQHDKTTITYLKNQVKYCLEHHRFGFWDFFFFFLFFPPRSSAFFILFQDKMKHRKWHNKN